MLTTRAAILRLRRDLTVGVLLKALLVGGLLAAVWVPSPTNRTAALVAVGAVWLALSYSSAKGSRLSADAPALIVAGQFDEAERQIEESLRSFSLFRAVKLQSLHHLALLRHAQRRWPESALLSRALLGQRLGVVQGLSIPSRLLLADAALELNDLPAAHEALTALYAQRLSLNEVLNLLRLQVDYEARIGAWRQMMAGVMNKVQLAELMPASAAGRTQAFLALAARHAGRADWSDWLRRRAELLVDPAKLVADRPALAELWRPGGAGAEAGKLGGA